MGHNWDNWDNCYVTEQDIENVMVGVFQRLNVLAICAT